MILTIDFTDETNEVATPHTELVEKLYSMQRVLKILSQKLRFQ